MAKNDKIYDEFEVNFDLRSNSREELRKKTVNTFLSEKGGYWKEGVKHVTRYKYFVEKLKDGKRIYLLRPTFLNKGIDFQVWVENWEENEDKRPSHKDVFEDLEIKKEENPKDFPLILESINKVSSCEEPDEVIKELKINFKKGLSIELLLKLLK